LFFLIIAVSLSLSLPCFGQTNAARAAAKGDIPPDSEIWYKGVTQTSESGMHHLKGAAEVHTSEMKITADEIDFNEDTAWAYARGHVHLVHYVTGDILNADHAEYNLRTEEGKFFVVNGTSPTRIITSPGLLTTTNPFYYEGQSADRIKGRIILHKGFITDCKTPKPWWIFEGPTFDIVPGQRAIARRSIFRVRHIPVLYMPYFRRTLGKNERQSGFLSPSAGHSNFLGYILDTGYYWAINRSYDLDYLFTDYTQRGTGHTVDFRGKPNDVSSFSVNFFGVQDRGIKFNEQGYATPPNCPASQPSCPDKQGGFQLQAAGRTELFGFRAMLDVNYLSSFPFAAAFTNNFVPNHYSVGFLQRHFDNDIYALNIVFSRNEVYESFNSNAKPAVIQKLPMLETSGRLQQILQSKIPIWFSFNASGGLISRSEPLTPADAPTNTLGLPTAIPSPAQPATATGLASQRIDVRPTLSSAVSFAGFSLYPSVSFEATDYNHQYSSNSELTATPIAANLFSHDADFVADFRVPSLERIFTPPTWMHLGVKVKHVIEAEAQYEYVTGINQFQKTIHYDGTDIVSNTNQLTIGITNRIYKKDKDGKVSEFFTWRLRQARYFDPTFGGTVTTSGQRYVNLAQEELTPYTFLDGPRSYSPVISTLTINPWNIFGLTYDTAYDPLRHRFDYHTITANLRYSKYVFDIGETAITSDQIFGVNASGVGPTLLPLDPLLQLFPLTNQGYFRLGYGSTNRQGFNAAAQVFYDFLKNEVTNSNYQVSYNTNCCGFTLQLRRINNVIRDENQYLFSFSVANIGSLGNLPRQNRIF
jgi:LPS-assembly protein